MRKNFPKKNKEQREKLLKKNSVQDLIFIKQIGLFLLLFFITHSYAQDSLKLNHQNLVTDQNGKVLDKINLVNTVRPNEFAFKHLQAATDSRIFSTVFFTGAGFSLGYTAGYFLVTQTVPRTMAIIGASCLTGGILLKIRSNNQLKKCVNVYNSDLNSNAYHNTQLELSWTINQNGLGFNLYF